MSCAKPQKSEPSCHASCALASENVDHSPSFRLRRKHRIQHATTWSNRSRPPKTRRTQFRAWLPKSCNDGASGSVGATCVCRTNSKSRMLNSQVSVADEQGCSQDFSWRGANWAMVCGGEQSESEKTRSGVIERYQTMYLSAMWFGLHCHQWVTWVAVKSLDCYEIKNKK